MVSIYGYTVQAGSTTLYWIYFVLLSSNIKVMDRNYVEVFHNTEKGIH